MPALRASVMRDFFEIIEREGWYDSNLHNKSSSTYILFGNRIEFVSIDESSKVKGRKRNVCFINEANELYLEDFRQLNIRTTDVMILDYNPSDFFSWIYDHILTRDDCSFFQSTYKDNPFLEPAIIEEIERFKETDENYWRIYGLGERGINESAIFPKFEIIDEMPPEARFIAYGMDWGFTNDPSTLIRVHTHGHFLYLHEELYETGLTNLDLVDRLRKIVEGREEIIADSSEPKSIEELFRHGLNIKGARKGRDSINAGIDIMKRHKIHVTKASVNLIKELQNYKWQTDKNGRQINVPEQRFDHAVDAVRYVCLNKLATNRQGKYFIA